MPLPSLKDLNDQTLHTELRNLRGTESEIIAEIVLHLHEVLSRGIYRDAGYSSLFTYCTAGLGYSEGAACRRIEAAKALDTSPEVYERLKAGKISLCSINRVAKVLTKENKEEVLNLVEGKPKLEVERVAAQYGAPRPEKKKESVRVVKREVQAQDLLKPEAPKTEERYSVTVELTKEEMELVTAARNVIGHCQVKDVLVKGAREIISKRTRTRKVTATVAVKSAKSAKSRYIPKAVQREVRERDGNRCTFVSEDKKRCTECQKLQFDHVTPWAKGGDETAENLRLMCSAHNQLVAERAFGREFMQGKRRRV